MNLSKEKMSDYFEQVWEAATIGDTWRLNKEAKLFYDEFHRLIESQPEVDEKFIEKWSYDLEWEDKDELRNDLIPKMLREIPIRIKEKK